MADVASLKIRVDAREAKNAAGELDRLGRSSKQAESAAATLGRAYSRAGSAIGAFLGSIAVREVIQAADGYKLLNARIQLVTGSAKEYAAAQRGIIDIAQRSRVGLEQTGNLYTSLAQSTSSLGVSQEDVLKVTESINQALIISGTSASSAQAALVQLGQGFASGALRGEELNSVLEQAPRLAQAIADGLGVSRGQLRELGKDGELTAEKVFKALLKSGDALDKEFKKVPLTVSQAVGQISDSLSLLIGRLDEATGATSTLAGFLANIGRGISASVRLFSSDEIERVRAELDLLLQRRDTFSGLVPEIALRPLNRLIAETEARLAALQRRAALGTPKAEDQSSAEARRLGLVGPTAVPDSPRPRRTGGAAPVDQVGQYLSSLQDQIRATRELSAAEEVLELIQLGRLGKVTPAQQTQLVNLAEQLDEIRALQEREKLAAKEQAEALAARNRVLDEGRAVYEATRTPVERLAAETDRLNKLLQEGAIDWDTYSRAIFAAQDEFDQITKKANETASDLDKFAERAAENVQKALGDELTNILEGDFDNIGKAFTSLINRMVAEAIAADLAKALGLGGSSGGGGGFLGDLVKTGLSFLTGSRAIGGPVSAGGLYRVNERGPELLNVAGKQFLMMGAQGGHVEPNGGGGHSISVVNNFSIQGPVDRRSESQIAAAAARGLQRGQRNL